VRVFVDDQEKRSPSVPTIVIGGVGGRGLRKLAGSCCVLFLQEQVRDLWVQEFLRDLVVSVATPSVLTGLIFLVEILHCGLGGNVKQVARTSKQISSVCDYLSFSFSLVFISCMLISFTSFICLIFTCA